MDKRSQATRRGEEPFGCACVLLADRLAHAQNLKPPLHAQSTHKKKCRGTKALYFLPPLLQLSMESSLSKRKLLLSLWIFFEHLQAMNTTLATFKLSHRRMRTKQSSAWATHQLGGVANKPIRIHGNKVLKKMMKHWFSVRELYNFLGCPVLSSIFSWCLGK